MLEYAPHGQIMQWDPTTKSHQVNPQQRDNVGDGIQVLIFNDGV